MFSTQVCTGRNFSLLSALAANEIALGSGQKNTVDARIVFGAVQKFLLEAGGSYVVDNEPAAGHKTRLPPSTWELKKP